MSMDDIIAFATELKELLEKYNVSLGVELWGDTHGITSEDFCVLSDNDKIVLSDYSTYLDSYDLKRFLENIKT